MLLEQAVSSVRLGPLKSKKYDTLLLSSEFVVPVGLYFIVVSGSVFSMAR
jgi:hypothetical protein